MTAALSLAAGGAALAAGRRGAGETTLAAAWWWALAALVSWSLVEGAVGAGLLAGGSGAASALRFAAIALSLCPALALLGAKRPQHQAWNFVVLSLWAIVTLPAAEAFFLGRGPQWSLGDARRWLLWILVALGPLSYGATPFGLSALLVAAGQVIALSPLLPLLQRPLVPVPQAAGLAVVALGLVAAGATGRLRRPPPAGYDRLWRDFRDSFGAFWALRVQERVNAAARQYDWPLELTWRGFRPLADAPPQAAIPADIEPALRATLRGLLRRFASHRWMADRLGPLTSESASP